VIDRDELPFVLTETFYLVANPDEQELVPIDKLLDVFDLHREKDHHARTGSQGIVLVKTHPKPLVKANPKPTPKVTTKAAPRPSPKKKA
jgi:hypothetical protein